ncbi:PepSY-associated TM helix domain-containing protein [Leeuwenhoekiella nanhaiensis]|uniref:Sulfite reductase n=1 Tax=Leeuwenhoekiella nanhaiensis TaxID=1655491 RepID=A0A2G1VP95_9FLAO|nr:PepSY-associated TM helix domain-containing protein [Leeuwenhoekiella nanhaiensis]PHQ28588.1 sulfite reductase [Leeuwenhoekiella nanhaiensis]
MKKKKSFSFRKLINDVHLWLGLASGIILFLVCLSGSILAFEHEIKAFFEEDLKVEPKGEMLSLKALETKIRQNHAGTLTSVNIPADESAPYTFTIKENPEERRGTNLQVNPYTAETLIAGPNPADGFCFFFFRMHRWLLFDSSIGRPIVGVATIIFLILSITGLVLWFPRKLKRKNFKAGFKIKTKANWKRVNHDLHNTLGFYALIFIVIMGITGLCWSFEGYREGLGNLIGTPVFNRSSPEFEVPETATTLDLDAIEEVAARVFPFDGDLSISLPGNRADYFSLRKNNASGWSPVAADRAYIAKNGEVLALDIFADKPLNVQFASLIKPLHTGEVFGMFSKIIYFLACLIATSLPITGTLIWINKMKKKK